MIYPNYYDSYEQFVEARDLLRKAAIEIGEAVIETAPTEEIRQALLTSLDKKE